MHRATLVEELESRTLLSAVVGTGESGYQASPLRNSADIIRPSERIANAADTVIGSSATLIKIDTTTRGTWSGVYGADGYSIVGGTTNLPSYATLSTNGASRWTWAASTSDTRAPQSSFNSSTRVAACDYSNASFSYDLNLTDGQAHQVALYLLDWDNKDRAEDVTISDAATGTTLDTRYTNSFGSGEFMAWSVSGHVNITITRQYSDNAVVSGLFFGAFPNSSSAAFLGVNAKTEGSWSGIYGADGYKIIGGVTNLPSYATLSTGAPTWTWAANTTDIRAPQVDFESSNRVAACNYGDTSVSYDLNLTDGQVHQVEFYFVDWDHRNRNENITISDATTGAVLASTASPGYVGDGVYAIWNLSGHVTITIGRVGGDNAVISAILFGGAPSHTASVTFVKTDATTQGNWSGVYGADGYDVFNDAASLPSYAALSASGASPYTWAKPTSDTRALQDGPGAQTRTASCLYANTSFSLDLNLTDGQTHQIALYLLDWDNQGRSATITISDASSGAVLDTEYANNFGSRYWVWNITGHVKITIARTAGPNAVVSGLFFG